MVNIRKITILILLMLLSVSLFACNGKTEFELKYTATLGGTVEGEINQTVEKGANGTVIVAVESEGYKFVRWSDNGSTSPERIDKNVNSSIIATAEFKQIMSVEYLANSNGTISGNVSQNVLYGENAKMVIAVPNQGYSFSSWSDNKYYEPERTDENVTENISVTALFERQVFYVLYHGDKNGTIDGEKHQRVLYGENASTVTAIPSQGYKFVKWSDNNSTDPVRMDINITAPISATAIFEMEIFTARYVAGENGSLDGITFQTIDYGENASTVIAKPESKNYMFVKWSDNNSTDPVRTDKNVTSNINAIAIFGKTKRSFTYQYINATANNTDKSIELAYENFGASFIVPGKEHFTFDGWYLEKEYKTKVSDNLGNLIIGREIFENNSFNLYAKWDVIEKITYKVLMVYVDEVQATLQSNMHNPGQFNDVIDVNVNYKMSKLEKQICELISLQFSKYLNEMMEGLITFEVDTYFTKEIIGIESFSRGVRYSGSYEYGIFANNIPELAGKLDGYRSVLTTFGMNDFDNLLHVPGASATAKYASLHLESLCYFSTQPDEKYLDLSDPIWASRMGSYLHEFTHTVEMTVAYGSLSNYHYEYHEVIAYYLNNHREEMSSLDVIKLYLLNRALLETDGETGGIPYVFWKGEMNIRAAYVAGVIDGWSAGKIFPLGEVPEEYDSGANNQVVSIWIPFGSSLTIEAVPLPGFKFVRWSDGIMTAVRQDTHMSDFRVEAIFERIE